MADSQLRGAPPDFYRWALVAIASFVFSAAFVVASVFLFTFCVPFNSGGPGACIFPHLAAATGFSLLAAALLGVGAYAADRAVAELGPQRSSRPSVSAGGAPRNPDTPRPASWSARVRRGLDPRSWIDDVPAPAESPTDEGHRFSGS